MPDDRLYEKKENAYLYDSTTTLPGSRTLQRLRWVYCWVGTV